MAGLAAGLARVLPVDFAAGSGCVHFMAIRAGRFSLDLGLAGCFRSVAVQFFGFVAVEALHAFFKMNIPDAAVPSRKFREDPSAMAGGAGFRFIFLLKAVVGEESLFDAGDRRRSNVAVSAARMARPAGLFKDLGVELFGLRF